ncbi:glycosyltransferase family 2 protein [Bacteroides sp. 519]|uniref:glycosyltransferase family 2 protein n=1 Tax=Bacteroides sp. 519 TaxID=2302937 RepID=UPI0013D79AEC|nr:glycosyltransferase family 2 protein [Bacteroides sp. 519]NDV57807.1 glycosyltransferase family 2 protein [Bacteroides sp. 519]
MNGISVIMPTYNQASYIKRAILSLINQTYTNWELIIVNDGSTDNTENCIRFFQNHPQIRVLKNEKNKGLGYALNKGIDHARYNYIAYLPSDDYFYFNHLETLINKLTESDDIVLAYTNASAENIDSTHIKYQNANTNGVFNGYCLQLVQTAHKKNNERWVERSEWVSDDLFKMYWCKLTKYGNFVYIPQTTANWTHHSNQRHRIINENEGGGIYIYHQYYQVEEPLNFKVSEHRLINEFELYKDFRTSFPSQKDGLKILIVGDLAYNAERIYALEEAGHKLYAIWTQRPSLTFSTVGPLAFGNVESLSFENRVNEIERVKPDIIYALLNWDALDTVYDVFKSNNSKIPFIWHFKEGPYLTMLMNKWEKLIEMYEQADGRIFINEECKDWYEQFLITSKPTYILDGDLPKKDYFTNNFSTKLSDQDGEIHTVVPGRIVGVGMKNIKTLADNGIHIHIYHENYFDKRLQYNMAAKQTAPHHYHIHPTCTATDWVKEFSQYDAGWLHCFKSKNQGVLMNANWDDLNLPARMNTLAAAGLPMIQMNNSEHLVAMQSKLRKDNLGIFFESFIDLAQQLHNTSTLKEIQKNVRDKRFEFSFDHYVPELISFFRKVIESKSI